jgi:hypothetical protein
VTGLSLEQIESAGELSVAERAELIRLEEVIERGVKSFADTGQALARVRDSRLYRETHATFDDYCRVVWDMRREVADRLIRAAEVVASIAPTNPTGLVPTSESQARELAPLLDEPEKLARVWESATSMAAAAERPVTAADVRDARRQLEPNAEASAAAPAPAPVPVSAEEASGDLRFAHIEESVQLLKTLPAPDRIVWPVDGGDVEAVGEAVEWLAKFAPALARSWREHKRSHRRLHAVS